VDKMTSQVVNQVGGECHVPSIQLITLDEGEQSSASNSGAAGQSSDVRSSVLNTDNTNGSVLQFTNFQ
jgi:hypothetical protein